MSRSRCVTAIEVCVFINNGWGKTFFADYSRFFCGPWVSFCKLLPGPGAVTKLFWKVLGDALVIRGDIKVNCLALTLFERFRITLPLDISASRRWGRRWIARRNKNQASGLERHPFEK